MAVKSHVHKLRKYKYKTGIAVFFCTLDCNYKIEAPFALGKTSLCNICGEPFVMNEYTIKLIKPHCSNCGRVEVKTPDGKKHYVRKIKTEVLARVADDEANDLRARLDRVVSEIPATLDDDI